MVFAGQPQGLSCPRTGVSLAVPVTVYRLRSQVSVEIKQSDIVCVRAQDASITTQAFRYRHISLTAIHCSS